MNEIISKLNEENEFIRELFNLNGDETQLQQIKDIIQNSDNGPYYFIKLFDHYSFCRPNYHNISKALVECIYSCFPEQINEIQQNIKDNTYILQFTIFPEEFPRNKNKEQNKMFLLLQKDDIDGFISFLSKNPTIDIKEEQELEYDGYYYWIFDETDLFHLLIFVVSLVH